MNFFIIIFSYFFLCNVIIYLKPRIKRIKPHNILFLISHPDDESMFFGPTIINEIYSRGTNKIYILCLSIGNVEGLGNIRKEELMKAAKVLGIKWENIKIINHPQLQDSLSNRWNHEIIKTIILDHIDRIHFKEMITFDDYGVSYHPNHIDTFMSVLRMNRSFSLTVIESVNLFRKYLFFNDIVLSLLEHYLGMCSDVPILTWNEYFLLLKALYKHNSQMVWYRKLYSILSRYMIVNTLKTLD